MHTQRHVVSLSLSATSLKGDFFNDRPYSQQFWTTALAIVSNLSILVYFVPLTSCAPYIGRKNSSSTTMCKYANETNERINLSFENAVNDASEWTKQAHSHSKSNRWNGKTLAPDDLFHTCCVHIYLSVTQCVCVRAVVFSLRLIH